ncbi:MAG: TonB-dependent receptor [Bacteroidaceae bacterium]|nr:TonB-dependent receptor [Bacteroidaceae bacterium]
MGSSQSSIKSAAYVRRSFHRFSHKGYAIFASLHREVRIGVLSVGMLASVNIPKVQAVQVSTAPDEDTEADEKELTEVAVTGTMSPLTALQSARIVGVITRQQIEAAAAQSVNDLLKLAAGVDVRQRGGFGIQTDISINGSTFDQITILLNGINLSSPHTGHLAADFPVSIADIERIEILEGAASRVYGASAFGGAINIVTRKDYTPHIEAGVQGGMYKTFGGDVRGTFKVGSLSAAYLRSDGATTNSDFQRGQAYLNGGYDAETFRIDLQAGYSLKAYGANTFYSAAYPNQFERNRRIITSLSAETKGRVRVRPEIYWNRAYDNFELIRNETKGENFHRTDVHGARVTAGVRWCAGQTTLGAEVREEGIYSTALGKPLQQKSDHKVPGEDLYYTRHDSRTNICFNAEHTLVLPRFTASAGVLANYNTRFDTGLSFYPGIDIAYTPESHWRLFASYNKGFRLPTFTDLYYKSPTHEGNQGMKAEESHCVQIGATYRHSVVDATVKAFYHRGTDLIDWVMYSADDVFHSANFDLDNMGLSAQAALRFTELFHNEKAYLQRLTVGYTYMHQHRRDEQYIYKSNYAMEYLRHKLVATLDHRIVARLTASWSVRWQDRMGSYILYEDARSTGQLVDYKPYATLDLKLRWTAPHYEVWVEGTNLTNHTYYDLGNIPQPGIVVLAGARVKF